MDFIIKLITKLLSDGFTGSVEIHFFKGGIGKIVKHESVK